MYMYIQDVYMIKWYDSIHDITYRNKIMLSGITKIKHLEAR